MLTAKLPSILLSNLFIVFFLIAIFTTITKVRRVRLSRRPVNASYVFWGELLFYSVGFGMLWSGAVHAYAQQAVASSFGWQPSPFAYELGWAQIGLSVVAMASLWRGTEFRLAATTIFVIASFAAAFQHIAQMRYAHNYAAGNTALVLWFGDILLPLILLVLAIVNREEELRRY